MLAIGAEAVRDWLASSGFGLMMSARQLRGGGWCRICQALQDRHREGAGLAGAGRSGQCENVTAGQRLRDGLRLDRRGVGIALARKGTRQRRKKGEIGKARHGKRTTFIDGSHVAAVPARKAGRTIKAIRVMGPPAGETIEGGSRHTGHDVAGAVTLLRTRAKAAHDVLDVQCACCTAMSTLLPIRAGFAERDRLWTG